MVKKRCAARAQRANALPIALTIIVLFLPSPRGVFVDDDVQSDRSRCTLTTSLKYTAFGSTSLSGFPLMAIIIIIIAIITRFLRGIWEDGRSAGNRGTGRRREEGGLTCTCSLRTSSCSSAFRFCRCLCRSPSCCSRPSLQFRCS